MAAQAGRSVERREAARLEALADEHARLKRLEAQ